MLLINYLLKWQFLLDLWQVGRTKERCSSKVRWHSLIWWQSYWRIYFLAAGTRSLWSLSWWAWAHRGSVEGSDLPRGDGLRDDSQHGEPVAPAAVGTAAQWRGWGGAGRSRTSALCCWGSKLLTAAATAWLHASVELPGTRGTQVPRLALFYSLSLSLFLSVMARDYGKTMSHLLLPPLHLRPVGSNCSASKASGPIIKYSLARLLKDEENNSSIETKTKK